jgi:hypothetical protein
MIGQVAGENSACHKQSTQLEKSTLCPVGCSDVLIQPNQKGEEKKGNR